MHPTLLHRARVKGQEGLVDLRLAQGRIAVIVPSGPEAEVGRAGVIDVDGRLVVPGFVDAHTHLDKGLVSGRAVNRSGTLGEALRVMGDAKRGFTLADIQGRARRQIEMAVFHGTTAIRTHVDIDSTVGLLSVEALRALREELKGTISLQLVALPHGDPVSSPEFLKRFREAIELSDLIGGVPCPGDGRFLDLLFALAREFDRDLDLHVDETDEPEPLAIWDVARKTIAEGYEGRVTVGHLCGLSSLPTEKAREAIALIRDAGLNVITLPSTNLYLQGRGDDRNPRRGITRVRELLAAGVPVAYASDNIRDAFNPFGNGDMLEAGLLLAHGAHMGRPDDLVTILEMATEAAGRMFYRTDGYGIRAGNEADVVVLDTDDFAEAVLSRPTRLMVFKAGRMVARNSKRRDLFL